MLRFIFKISTCIYTQLNSEAKLLAFTIHIHLTHYQHIKKKNHILFKNFVIMHARLGIIKKKMNFLIYIKY